MIETFAALSDPNRLRIVSLLLEGPQPVGTIAERLRLNQPQASKHLMALKKAHLVEVEARAQQQLYQLDPAGLLAVHDWLEPYRRLWSARFAQMDEVIAQMVREEAHDRKD
ncbi:metalloregulator ArsR/SmtB family transcription factor [Asticcacaulis sp. ZE23SCel15]|uniref:ArsR/SmtB family transcription factor n=1 Tax=Asticcacaulis sp. ZE23SCel15 TaxID=3059027 RepID=UPI00265D6AB5|nr:metalloregulator ArsR/SmtB family transcription factor [Asticcacaulis sp. ZE23SCel15]WKL56692.1 metalloregulator ArsR/SmtB family transcription factor [Asticcacaulis sp. ZE23SCel15]